MGFFRNLFDVMSTVTISDKFGLGAGFLYADFAGEKASERELEEMKAGVAKSISEYICEYRNLLNPWLINTLQLHVEKISNSNKYTADIYLNELKYFLNHTCFYLTSVNEILKNGLQNIEAVPEDALDDGVKRNAISKTKEVINCSNPDDLYTMLQNLFNYYSDNGINIENKDELFEKFDVLKNKYLQG